MAQVPDYEAALREVSAQLLEATEDLRRAVARLQAVLRLRDEARRGWGR